MKNTNMGKLVLLTLISFVLIISFVQAYQIETLKGESTTKTVQPETTQARILQEPPAQQPTMVGGC